MDKETTVRKKVAALELVKFHSAATPHTEYTLNEIGLLPLEKKLTVYFTVEQKEGFQRFSLQYLPEQCREQFHLSDPTQPYLYTNFEASEDGKPIEVDLNEYPGIARAYFTKKIRDYLSPLSYLTQSNFLNDSTFWFLVRDNGAYASFEKYTLKVVHRFRSKSFLLNITYSGMSHILTTSLEAIAAGGGFDTRQLGKVVFAKKIYTFKKRPEQAKQEPAKVFPVSNRDLEKYFQLDIPYVPNKNKYSSNISKIEAFFQQHLNTDAFKAVIPLNNNWEKLPSSQVCRIGNPGLQFQFGASRCDKDLLTGLRKYGPYIPVPEPVAVFFIYHQQDEATMKTLKSAMDGSNGNHDFMNILSKTLHFDDTLDIVFTDRENPLTGTTERIQQLTLTHDRSYLAIYLSPYGRFSTTEEEHAVYFKLKMHLIRRNIAMQAVEVQKVKLSGQRLNFWIPNIAIAAVAKLGGTPWRPGNELRDELVVGFGLYESRKYGRKYVGSSVCFKNDGTFIDFNYFPSDEPWEMAASIEKALTGYLKEHHEVSRLVIHYYKDISSRDLQPIEDKLNKFRANIPVVVIRINKSDSNTFLVKDSGSPHMVLQAGSYVQIHNNEYLLYVNDRFSHDSVCKSSPMPIRLGIRCTQTELLQNKETIKDLMQQLYDFCFLHWRSLTQHKNPVTTSYPRMLAGQASWFDDEILSPEMRRRPFFL